MKQASPKIVLSVMCLDLAVCGVSLLVAMSMLDHLQWNTDTLVIRHPLRQLMSVIVLNLLWQFSLVAGGVYQSGKPTRLAERVLVLAAGTSLTAVWTAVWLSFGQLSQPLSLERILSTSLAFWIISFMTLALLRAVARVATRLALREERNIRNVLIIGTNSRAIAIADSLVAAPDTGYKLLGFIDNIWHFEGAPEHYKQMLIGNPNDTLGFLRTLPLNEVIVALPIASSYQFTQQIMDWCRQQGIPVSCDGILFNDGGRGNGSIETSQRLITLHETERHCVLVFAKRCFDIGISTVALVALMPVIGGIALAIRMSSPGPILFLQERLGKAKRRFKIYKFRTMVVDAEAQMAKVEHLNQSAGPTFKLQHDPRITPIGVFLRKTSLDELPQLFNVWLGDMSLVGPRPLPLRDYRGFSEDWHRRRFSVKPGITCLWQVSGRSSIGFAEWMQLDMDYIDRWSFWLDLKILAQTIPAVVRGSGAM